MRAEIGLMGINSFQAPVDRDSDVALIATVKKQRDYN